MVVHYANPDITTDDAVDTIFKSLELRDDDINPMTRRGTEERFAVDVVAAMKALLSSSGLPNMADVPTHDQIGPDADLATEVSIVDQNVKALETDSLTYARDSLSEASNRLIIILHLSRQELKRCVLAAFGLFDSNPC